MQHQLAFAAAFARRSSACSLWPRCLRRRRPWTASANGHIKLGYLADARPFTVRTGRGRPRVTRVALCQQIADQLKTQLALPRPRGRLGAGHRRQPLERRAAAATPTCCARRPVPPRRAQGRVVLDSGVRRRQSCRRAQRMLPHDAARGAGVATAQTQPSGAAHPPRRLIEKTCFAVGRRHDLREAGSQARRSGSFKLNTATVSVPTTPAAAGSAGTQGRRVLRRALAGAGALDDTRAAETRDPESPVHARTARHWRWRAATKTSACSSIASLSQFYASTDSATLYGK